MGYEHFLKVLADEKDDEYLELRRWAGDSDPERFDAKAASWQVRADN